MCDRNYHLIHHHPEDNLNYIRTCPHCRLERRIAYGNNQSHRSRNDPVQTQYPPQPRSRRIRNRTARPRETHLRHNALGEVNGFQVVEPIGNNRYIVESYTFHNGPNRNWHLDDLVVMTGDEINGDAPPPQPAFEDVVVYTSVYHLNKNTELNIVKDLSSLCQENCVICMENFKTYETTRKIKKCQHLYHQSCFDQWAETNYKCPLCNSDFTE